MKKLLLATAAVIVVAGAHCAMAADLPVKEQPPPPPAIYDWTGFYAGFNVGAAWGSYDPQTSTIPDGVINASTPSVNAAGIQSLNPLGFTGGAQAGYNWQLGNLVAGIEADFNYLHLNGTAIGGPVPLVGAGQVVVTSNGDADLLFTLRPRIGWTVNNWLFYATGGLAVTDVNDDFALTSGNAGNCCDFKQVGRNDSFIQAGYAVGGGIETAITDRLSVKAEYLHVNFDRTYASTTSTNHPAQVITQSADLRADIARVGFNYRLGGVDTPVYAYAGSPMANAPIWAWPAINTSDWEFNAGSRTWFSSGTVGAPNPLLLASQALASRLIFNLDAVSGETYARVDHSSGLFVKGYLGAGGIINGNLHDEDFPVGGAYSNTLSSAAGSLGYATIDLGYTFLRSAGAKVGAFVGYNYYTQHANTYSCVQLAGSSTCAPASPGQPNNLYVAEDDHFNSLRVGLSSEAMLTDRLKFTADAAYVPWTDFSGLDDHNYRQNLISEAASTGDGVMLEAVLSYDITANWNVGVGGRYWAWNTRTGTATFDYLGLAPDSAQPARYTTERYGAFVQMGYHWGDTTPAGGTSIPVKAPIVVAGPINWTGLYVGGHLGGGWSDDHWSDPFGSTPGAISAGVATTNVAGFGDAIHATGPLGGGHIGANWQTGQWVLGVQADADAADLRGDNTCFSGLGGINCQHIVNSLGTVTGRVGFAWDRSLIYAKGGGAWTDTTYNLLGNTNGALKLGTGSTSVNAGGWTVGAGLEYALTNHWTTLFEYDHIGIGSVTVPFPTVALINAQTISVKQSLDIFKMGVNYKFDWATLVVASN